jgi:hypothetical protein
MTALYHGAALDAAMKRADDPERLFAEVCPDALTSRTTAEVDAQVTHGAESFEETRGLLRREWGREPTGDEVHVITLRAAIGGAFNRGLQTGLELRHESKSVA